MSFLFFNIFFGFRFNLNDVNDTQFLIGSNIIPEIISGASLWVTPIDFQGTLGLE